MLLLITQVLPWMLLILCRVRETVCFNNSYEILYHTVSENIQERKSGDIPLLNRKIYRGMRVFINEHPYIASIRRTYAHYCTATIITKNLLISIAHPLLDVPINELGVIVGQSYADRGSILHTVIFVILHENFDKYTLQNDISLIRIYEDIVFKTAVKSIRLVTPTYNLDGGRAFVTGWGRCDLTGSELCLDRSSKYFPDEKIDPMLRTISFDLVHPNNYCNGYEQQDVFLKPGMICLGWARVQDPVCPCLGVPGAPLVSGAHLLGLLSWGHGCSYVNDMPLVYTDIRYFQPWIHHNMEILQNISQENLSDIFNVTRASFLSQWLEATRIVKPTTLNVSFREMIPLNVDTHLVRLNGSVYDVRDFVHNGRYRYDKIEMYKALFKQHLNMQRIALMKPEKAVEMRPFLGNDSLRFIGNDSHLYKDYPLV